MILINLTKGNSAILLELGKFLNSTESADMKKKLNSDMMIEELVAAVCGEEASEKSRHVYRETLRGLVRLARTEMLHEMKSNVDRLSGGVSARTARRQTKLLLASHRSGAPDEAGQWQLAFNKS